MFLIVREKKKNLLINLQHATESRNCDFAAVMYLILISRRFSWKNESQKGKKIVAGMKCCGEVCSEEQESRKWHWAALRAELLVHCRQQGLPSGAEPTDLQSQF